MAKVFNKGKRRITYGDKDGEFLDPNKIRNVEPDVATNLKRLFPSEVVDLDNVDDMKAQFEDKTFEEEKEAEKRGRGRPKLA